jgi:hypothetical protein
VSDAPSNNGRKTDGRFAAGNKAARGKPKGAHHRTTVMAEKLLDKDAGQIIKKLIDAQKWRTVGDQICRRALAAAGQAYLDLHRPN